MNDVSANPEEPAGPPDARLRPVEVIPLVREPLESDLVRLQCRRGYPMVSVLMATQPGRTMALHDRARLARLADVATQRLARELRPSEIDHLMRPLRALMVRAVDEPMGRGLVLYAAAGDAEAFRLPETVGDRVVVDPTFATRDIARSLALHPNYRLLVLGGGQARLLVGTGRQLAEYQRPPFPMVDAVERSTADRRGHLLEAERSHRDQRRWDAFLRRVDDALSSIPSLVTLPLVVAAAEPLAGRFRRLCTDPVVGVLPGHHGRVGAGRLAELARPVVERYLAAQVAEHLAELRTAVNRRRAVFGMADVWRAAVGGDVRILLVEDDFSYPAVPAPDGRSLVRALDAEHPDVLDDAVDEVVEQVARSGGRTVFVRRGELPESRIAAITAHRTSLREVDEHEHASAPERPSAPVGG
jgi:hypothetical protein